jgi:hypothetical protein
MQSGQFPSAKGLCETPREWSTLGELVDRLLAVDKAGQVRVSIEADGSVSRNVRNRLEDLILTCLYAEKAQVQEAQAYLAMTRGYCEVAVRTACHTRRRFFFGDFNEVANDIEHWLRCYLSACVNKPE